MRIVYSYYVLDIVHEGHLLMMQNAKAIAGENGVSVVGILTDGAVMEKKRRPVMPFEQRVALAKAIKYADVVVAQETYSPLPNIEELRPDILMESTSHSDTAIKAGRALMQSMGGAVVVLPYFPAQSSTNIKQKIRGDQNNGDNCCCSSIPHPRSGSTD